MQRRKREVNPSSAFDIFYNSIVPEAVNTWSKEAAILYMGPKISLGFVIELCNETKERLGRQDETPPLAEKSDGSVEWGFPSSQSISNSINDWPPNKPLPIVAAKWGWVQFLDDVYGIRRGIEYDIMKMSARGYTCLHEAVYYGNYDVVTLLKRLLDARGKDKFVTSLFIENGQGETVFAAYDAGMTSWERVQIVWSGLNEKKHIRGPRDMDFFSDPRYHKAEDDVVRGYAAIGKLLLPYRNR